MKASTLIFEKLKMRIILSTRFLLICHICVTASFQLVQFCRVNMTSTTKIDKNFVLNLAKKWHFFAGKTIV
jgi:hypothetical protein